MGSNAPFNHIGCAKTSSDYKWFSSDMATVSIAASGVVQAKKPGKATVKVVSIFDSFNYDEVILLCLYILPVVYNCFFEFLYI